MLLRLSDPAQGRRGPYFQAQALCLSLGTRQGVNTRQFFFPLGVLNTIYKHCHA